MLKIKARTENILSSLFILGYDKIDAYMYTTILGKLNSECNKDDVIIYRPMGEQEYYCELEYKEDKKLSDAFLSCIDNHYGGYKLKDENSMNTNVAPFLGLNGVDYSFKNYICSTNNKLLANYINKKINMEEIIVKKINAYGVANIKNYPDLFCNKEKEIMYRMFGIEQMHMEQEKSARYRLSRRLEDDLK